MRGTASCEAGIDEGEGLGQEISGSHVTGKVHVLDVFEGQSFRPQSSGQRPSVALTAMGIASILARVSILGPGGLG